jgi:hypothetical protein
MKNYSLKDYTVYANSTAKNFEHGGADAAAIMHA